MSLVSINTSRTNLAFVSTFLSEMNIRLNDNQSTVLGYLAGTAVRGDYNTILGYTAAKDSRTCDAVTIVGYRAGSRNNGNRNTLVGAFAAVSMDTGADNTVLGAEAGRTCATGTMNCLLGALADASAADAGANTAVGSVATCGASSNVALGHRARADGGASLALGAAAVNTGRNSVVIGAGATNSGSNCIFLHAGGTDARVTNAADGLLYLDGRVVGEPLPAPAGAYRLSLCASEVRLGASSAGSTATAALTVTSSNVSVAAPLSTQRLQLSYNSAPAWSVSARGGYSSKRGPDLVLASTNSNMVVFTDEFAPELFNFTGKHRCRADPPMADWSPYVGRIVAALGRYSSLEGTPEICIDEAIPIVAMTRHAQDPRVFGVVAGSEPLMEGAEGTRRVFRLAHMRFCTEALDLVPSPSCSHSGMSRVVVNSVGEGGIYVCDANGPVRNGDLIASSPYLGYGMKQSDNIVASHTVAKATCDADFEGPGSSALPADEGRGRRAFIGCSYRC